MSQKLIIYTDGACKGNPGIGGWGAILMFGEHSKELYGAVENTTNNRMELMGVIEALKALKRPCTIELYTDSKYVQQGITQWVHGWIKRKWKDVKNVDLWQQLLELQQNHSIEWLWVRGHTGNQFNEHADKLANRAISEYVKL